MGVQTIVLSLLGVAVIILGTIPTPKNLTPEKYSPETPLSVDSLPVSSKNRLQNATILNTPVDGVEDIDFDKEGNLLVGLADGTILKIDPNLQKSEVIGKTQGHIFGVRVSRKGDKLAIADQTSGVKILDLKTKKITPLFSNFNGNKILSPNALTFGKNDQILYVTVSSNYCTMAQFHNMLLYSQGSGSILSYNFLTKQIKLLAQNLYFANGIQYFEEEDALYFAETSRTRVSKLQLSGENAGKITVIVNNLLGYPDNLHRAADGNLWVALPAVRDAVSNLADGNSLFRKIFINCRMTLGMFLMIANMKYAGGVKIDRKTGQILQYFFGKGDTIKGISGINENNGKVYLSSLIQNKLAAVQVSNLKQTQKQVKESSQL